MSSSKDRTESPEKQNKTKKTTESIVTSKDNPLNSLSQSQDRRVKNSQTFEKNLDLGETDVMEIKTAQQVIEKFKDSLDEDAQKINQWADD